MLIIRLTRRGRRNDPSFRLVVTEQTNPVKGQFLEEVGFLNPKTKAKSLKKERILYWLSQGAKTSATVHNLLVSEGVIQAQKVKAWRPKVSSSGSKKKEAEELSKDEKPKSQEEPKGEELLKEKEPGIKQEGQEESLEQKESASQESDE